MSAKRLDLLGFSALFAVLGLGGGYLAATQTLKTEAEAGHEGHEAHKTQVVCS